jgi:hypothetical protein
MKRRYGSAATDLFAALGRKIFVTQTGGDAAAQPGDAEACVGDLVLYDPETDESYQAKLAALRTATAAAESAAARAAAAEAAGAAATAPGCEAAGGDGGQASEGGGGVLGEARALDAGTHSSSSSGSVVIVDSDAALPSPTAPGAAATAEGPPPGSLAALRAAAAEARADAVQAQAAAAEAARSAGPLRQKVHADAFLVQTLRPHQREGLRFVFSCLCGTQKDGVSGAVLADGMGLGKTYQTVSHAAHFAPGLGPRGCLVLAGRCHSPTD